MQSSLGVLTPNEENSKGGGSDRDERLNQKNRGHAAMGLTEQLGL